jgi:hypothetical protein
VISPGSLLSSAPYKYRLCTEHRVVALVEHLEHGIKFIRLKICLHEKEKKIVNLSSSNGKYIIPKLILILFQLWNLNLL